MATSSTSMAQLCAFLAQEQEELDSLLRSLDEDALLLATPAQGWDIHDQLIHLAFGEKLAAQALADPDRFRRRLAEMSTDLEGALAGVHARGRQRPGADLLVAWGDRRRATIAALARCEEADRVPWAGPEMTAANFARARLMETFAHGHDIRDALELDRSPTPAMFEVAHLGVRTRGFSYQLRGLAVPEEQVRVELDGPDGPRAWGPASATDAVRGSVLDFCLVVTRRRHPADTALTIVGPGAAEWMEVAQAYLGPPTDHRPAGSFRPSVTQA